MAFNDYMDARYRAFQTYHKSPMDATCIEPILSQYHLNAMEAAGLRAELYFYHVYRKNYELTLGADCGDSCDFAGLMDGRPVRFDVTTNSNFKHVSHYVKASCGDFEYYVAEFDAASKNFKIYPVWQLASIPSVCCQGALAVPLVVIYPEDVSRGGTPDGWNYVKSMLYCVECETLSVQKTYDEFLVKPLSVFHAEASEYYESFQCGSDEERASHEMQTDYRRYLYGIYSYFKKVLGHDILAIGEWTYIMTWHDGSGYEGVKIIEKCRLLDKILPDDFEGSTIVGE